MNQSSEITLNRCRRNSELLSGFSIEPLCNQLELFGILLDALNHVDGAAEAGQLPGGPQAAQQALRSQRHFEGVGLPVGHKVEDWHLIPSFLGESEGI